MEEINQSQTPQPQPQQSQENTPVVTETPTPTIPPTTVTNSSNSSKTMYLIIGFVILVLIGMGAYILFPGKYMMSKKATTASQQNAPSGLPSSSQSGANQPIPVISPITSANVDQTLNNTDTTMQQSIDQANSDLNKVNSIDQTQDSTNGL